MACATGRLATQRLCTPRVVAARPVLGLRSARVGISEHAAPSRSCGARMVVVKAGTGEFFVSGQHGAPQLHQRQNSIESQRCDALV
jgi:hypothetical protein